MSLRSTASSVVRAALAGLFAWSLVFSPPSAPAAEAAPAEAAPRVEKFDLLKTKTAEYRNVTVTARNAVEIHISHDGGVQNVKLSELDEEALAALGLAKKPGAAANAESKATDAVKALMAKLPESLQPVTVQQPVADGADGDAPPEAVMRANPLPILLATLGPQVIFAVLAAAALLYLFSCYCLKLICEKAGGEAGLLVWLPVLQIFPMLRAAGMSPWWFLGFCLPGINIISQIVWSVKISEARGKTIWTALCLILPGTNIFAFLYLAFSSGKRSGGPSDRQDANESSDGLQRTKSRKIILGAPNPLRPAT